MQKYKILIVDDDQPLLDTLKQWFETEHECPTVTTKFSESALKTLKSESIDLVITGINQHEMNGIELTKEIRRQGGPPVIVMTGDATSSNREAALQAGAKTFLKKPCNLVELLQVVDQVMSGEKDFALPGTTTDKKIGLGGKIFLWIIGIIIVGSFVIAFINELFGQNGAVFAIVLFFVVIFFGFYIGKNR